MTNEFIPNEQQCRQIVFGTHKLEESDRNWIHAWDATSRLFDNPYLPPASR